MRCTGIIDEPVAPGGADNLGIEIHSKSLAKFIDVSQTPLTIGVQGEWGSGKTSLLNSVFHDFEQKQNVKQIWINSWEYSLLSSPEEALLKIINRIIDELVACDQGYERGSRIKEGVNQIFKGALRISASMALGLEAGQVAKELMETGDKDIASLRAQLSDLIESVAQRQTNPFTKFVVYVDDLDRIEPKNAVAVLELLKNIFSLPRCIFMLAIDYQVVVKGLEHKFGKQTAENEWEFRAFFDKIIQLPFMMPMGQYDIGQYVTQLLIEIKFVADNDFDKNVVKDAILRTIGGNPRSIKRLINSLSLIALFSDTKRELGLSVSEPDQDNEIDATQKKLLLFALLCIQIAYPQIYSLLIREPDFTSWDDEFAFLETEKAEEKDKETFDRDLAIVSKAEYCDEDWEQSLFRICYIRPRLRSRFRDISLFLNFIKTELFRDNLSELGSVIAEILGETSVTNVTSTDAPTQDKKRFTRTIYNGLDEWASKLRAEGFSEQTIAKTLNIHEIITPHSDEAVFSETGGCTYYFNSKKISALTIRSKKKPIIEVRFLKDARRDYRLPKIKGITTAHVRRFDPEKPTTVAFANFYCLNMPPDAIDDSAIRNALRQLARENLEHVSAYPEKIYPGSAAIRKELETNGEVALQRFNKELSDEYTYSFQSRD